MPRFRNNCVWCNHGSRMSSAKTHGTVCRSKQTKTMKKHDWRDHNNDSIQVEPLFQGPASKPLCLHRESKDGRGGSSANKYKGSWGSSIREKSTSSIKNFHPVTSSSSACACSFGVQCPSRINSQMQTFSRLSAAICCAARKLLPRTRPCTQGARETEVGCLRPLPVETEAISHSSRLSAACCASASSALSLSSGVGRQALESALLALRE